MKIFNSIIFTAILCAYVASANAQFEGELELVPTGCEATGQCTLGKKLRFVDSKNEIWEAAAGLVTDGASIPGIFQPFIGSPFDQKFIRAAVIHDHYCDRHVKSWRKTHRVFYEALINQGVSIERAKTMYLAVFVGGPKWIKLIPGVDCGLGCINSKISLTGTPGYMSRKADYSRPGLAEEMEKISNLLKADPEALTLEDIENRGRALAPTDYYFRNGDWVVVKNGPITE